MGFLDEKIKAFLTFIGNLFGYVSDYFDFSYYLHIKFFKLYTEVPYACSFILFCIIVLGIILFRKTNEHNVMFFGWYLILLFAPLLIPLAILFQTKVLDFEKFVDKLFDFLHNITCEDRESR